MVDLERRISRRNLLRASVVFGAVFLVGCERPAIPVILSPRKDLDPLTEDDIKEAANLALSDTNRVLGIALEEEKITPNITLIKTLSEYQKILKTELPSYIPQDETNRWAITTNPNSKNGNKIFVFEPGIANASRFLPNIDEGRKARKDFLAFVLGHEYQHFSAATYQSDRIHNEVFGRIFANLPAFKGKRVNPIAVRGAVVYGNLEGAEVQAYQNIEEAEAILIDDLIVRKNGRQKTGVLPKVTELGYLPQIEMYKELLTKVYGDLDKGLVALAQVRVKPGGREEFARTVGSFFKIPPEDQLFFSMSLAYAMDRGDRNLFTFYTTPKN